MNIVFENSNNNMLLKKGRNRFLDCPQDTFTVSYLPLLSYLTRPNDLGYPTSCEFRSFLMHLLGGLTINYFRHYMFSYVIADTVANTSLIL